MFLARGGGGGGLEPTAEKAVRKGRNWGRLGTRDDPREKPRRALFSSREETSAPCEFFLQVDASFPLKIRPDQRVYAARLWGESSKSILVSTAGGTAWNFGCRCKRDGFESYISNWANGWRGPDIFRSRIPSDRLGRRGLCARPPIKKISPAISCKYFLWRSARLLW